eukprot:15364342-Ditylum_brightwellii.AAC.1
MFDRIGDSLSSSKYAGNRLGDGMLAFGALIILKCSYPGLETTISSVTASIFANVDAKQPSIEGMVTSVPSNVKLQKLIA